MANPYANPSAGMNQPQQPPPGQYNGPPSSGGFSPQQPVMLKAGDASQFQRPGFPPGGTPAMPPNPSGVPSHLSPPANFQRSTSAPSLPPGSFPGPPPAVNGVSTSQTPPLGAPPPSSTNTPVGQMNGPPGPPLSQANRSFSHPAPSQMNFPPGPAPPNQGMPYRPPGPAPQPNIQSVNPRPGMPGVGMPGMRSPGPPLPSGTGNPQMGMPGMRSAAPPPPPGAASSQQMARPPGPPRSTAPPLGTAVSTANPAGRPVDLPVPYQGQAMLHQDGQQQTPAGLTPSSSEPHSQKSSRAPSPMVNFDALEGQFVPSPGQPGGFTGYPGQPQYPSHPTSQGQPPTSQGHPTASYAHPTSPQYGPLSGGQQPMMQPGQMPNQPNRLPGQMPPTSLPSQIAPPPGGVPPPGGIPPAGAVPPPGGFPPPGGIPPPAGVSSDQTPPHFPPAVNSQPPPSSQASHTPGGPGQRQYPQMGGVYGQTTPAAPPGPTQPPSEGPAGFQHNSMAQNSVPGLQTGMNNMRVQDGVYHMNLLQERNIIPPQGVETPKPNLHHDFKKINCNPEVFRCTMNVIPNSSSLLQKSRLPLGILIHPFKDLAQLPVIQSSVIVRCRSCRTYINPFVSFVDMRRWKCNLCYRVNELPDEFNFDPVSKTYGEPQRRPEIRSATIEFVAPSEYMLRPPQPAVYLYVLDVSFNAVETGYLQVFCQTLLEELDRIPGDSRTQIGFLTFDRSLHFYNLAEGLSQPQMMVVTDVDDIFVPCPDSLLVNLHESRELVIDLLTQLPTMFESNRETGSALGAALQVSYKLMSSTGGRVAVFQTQLPSVGPGTLKCREDPNERAGKKIHHMGPATDFYKKLSLDCSAQQIAVDLFMLNSQYSDIASVACISKYSSGALHYFPNFHNIKNPRETDRFEGTLRRYFTRKIGFESVMRIRCTRGISLHTFHGNFFVRSTDLLSLPNINPDAGFGMQMSIEDNIESNLACFQAALLYTSSRGERRIRVHTLCLPVTNQLTEIHAAADQQAIVGLLAKMGVDKSLSQSMQDARDAVINAAIDMLGSYGNSLTSAQRIGQLPCPPSLRLIPLYALALLKSAAFRVGSSTRLDDRVVVLENCKTQPLCYLLMSVYPDLYPVHALDDKNSLSKGEIIVPQPPLLQLSSANTDRHGAYLMDTGEHMILWLGAAISDKFCQDVLEKSNFATVPDNMTDLPELDNCTSERLRHFINHLNEQRPFPASFIVMREDSRHRSQFLQYMIEDRTESSFSYYEFLQHLQKEIKS